MQPTALVSGIARSSFDSVLLENMCIRPIAYAVASQMVLRIAVRNDFGKIYRIICANDSGQFFLALKQLAVLDFHDELSDPTRPGLGYHAIFNRMKVRPAPHLHRVERMHFPVVDPRSTQNSIG